MICIVGVLSFAEASFKRETDLYPGVAPSSWDQISVLFNNASAKENAIDQ